MFTIDLSTHLFYWELTRYHDSYQHIPIGTWPAQTHQLKIRDQHLLEGKCTTIQWVTELSPDWIVNNKNSRYHTQTKSSRWFGKEYMYCKIYSKNTISFSLMYLHSQLFETLQIYFFDLNLAITLQQDFWENGGETAFILNLESFSSFPQLH